MAECDAKTELIKFVINQIQNELQRNDLANNRSVIIKAAKLLKAVEHRMTRDRDAAAHAKMMNSVMAATPSFECQRAVADKQWTMQNQQQLYRFHFNELTTQIYQLKRQLNATQMELMEQMRISHDLSVSNFDFVPFERCGHAMNRFNV